MKHESKVQKIKRLMLDWEPARITLSKRHRIKQEELELIVVEGSEIVYEAKGNLRKKTHACMQASINSNTEFIVSQSVMLCGYRFHALRGGAKGRPEILVLIREIEPKHRGLSKRRLYAWINSKYIESIR